VWAGNQVVGANDGKLKINPGVHTRKKQLIKRFCTTLLTIYRFKLLNPCPLAAAAGED
jgi:hypothetical protein